MMGENVNDENINTVDELFENIEVKISLTKFELDLLANMREKNVDNKLNGIIDAILKSAACEGTYQLHHAEKEIEKIKKIMDLNPYFNC